MNSLEKKEKYNKEYLKKLRKRREEKCVCVSCGRKKKAKKYLICLKCRKRYRKTNRRYIEKDREKHRKWCRNYSRKRNNIPPSRWKVL